ncbi:MAG: nuclear transport factor 2 family protein [Actinobacteria bacterium]|nr:nuclear transport factor 2 family protein [Actinomycetota bacterium]
MNANEELVARFYSAFQRKDADAMAACYHPEVTFSDPVFQNLHGEHAGNMWRMLCARGADLVVEFREVQGTDQNGSAHWEAWYTFGATGRKVHNVIDSAFEFRDGKIIKHTDRFDFPKWAAQALGLSGRLLGRTSFLLSKVRSTGMKALAEFESRM